MREIFYIKFPQATLRLRDSPSGQSKETSVILTPLEPRHRRNVGIATICALPREADAVKALFDNCWDDTGQKHGKTRGDPNAYKIGAIGCHNVVLAHLPETGEINAASVTAYCKNSFENIKLALVIGICGGVPFLKGHEEIMLGDIVVSHGIVHYDFGKQYPEGFQMKDGPLDILPRPSMEIQSLLAKLKTYDDRKGLQEKKSEYLSTLQDKLPEMTACPGASEDKLYESTYRHKHYNPFLCGECANCNQKTDRVCTTAINSNCDQLKCSSTKLVSRRRPNQECIPVIHFGLIASGNMVMKSGEARDKIADKWEVIVFEMEGAGV